MAGKATFAPEPFASVPALSAGTFHDLLQAFERVRIPLPSDAERAEAERHRDAVKQLIEGHITDAGWRALLHKAREAAEHGAHESLLLRFPTASCADRGRALAALEPGWGSTLAGDAAAIYRRWQAALAPHGFTLTARILEYPGRIAGDAGLFLGWPGR